MLSFSVALFSLFGRPWCLVKKLDQFIFKSDDTAIPTIDDVRERMQKCKSLSKIHRAFSLIFPALVNLTACLISVPAIYESRTGIITCLVIIVLFTLMSSLFEWSGLVERYDADYEFFQSIQDSLVVSEPLTRVQLMIYQRKSEKIDLPVLHRDTL